MVTHWLNFFIVTKQISNRHHSASESFCSQFYRWKFLLELCNWHFLWQLCRWQQLFHICRFWGGTFCSRCNYVVRSFCCTLQVTVSAANMWVTIFILIMQMGVSVAIMQVVLSAVEYAHNSFYCNYAGDSFLIAM